MTPLQDAIQFITAQRDKGQRALDRHNVATPKTCLFSAMMAEDAQADIDAYDNVLTVLGNMELSEAEQVCYDLYTSRPRCDCLSEPESTLWLIGQRIFERIAAQRTAAQRREKS